jgi:NAD(P)-dependent dehydrogenase (short-subunit alcohol dehydrogenase family)
MQRLQNKIALVTGAARGIGAAVADAFEREGATVLRSDVLEIPLPGAIRLDVRDEADWRAAMGVILAAHGALHILVNNAGISGFDRDRGPQDPEHASLESWHDVHATNLDGTFLGCKHAIRAMKTSSECAIINIGSRSGVVGIPRAAAYASSKAAVRNHTKSVALYCQEMGYDIRCNVIQPAAIRTPMWDGMPLPARMGEPHDVAELAVYLASAAAAYVTGSEFNLDGGLLAGASAPPTPATS